MTMTGTAKREGDALLLDFTRPDLVLACADTPFVIAPAAATTTDDGCGTSSWSGPTEQITLLAWQHGQRDVILAAPPGVEEVRTARVREGCPNIDDEARPLLRHAIVRGVAPLFTEARP